MKKLAILLLATFSLISCSDDDGSGPKFKPSSITLQSEGGAPVVSTFTYDNKNRLQSVTVNGTTQTFAYDNSGKVVSVTAPGADPLLFTYADNGDFESFSSGNTVYPVTQLGDNSFSIGGETYGYTDNGDWSEFTSAYTFSYSSGKGAFANVKNLDLFALSMVDVQSLLYASRKQISSIISGGISYPVTTTPGDNGLPAQYTVADINISFQYTN